MMRRLAADETGIPALRHQRDPMLGGELADRGDLRGRAGAQHQRRAAVEQIALLGDIGLDVGRIGDGVPLADDLAELSDQLGRKRSDGGMIDVHGGVSSQASYSLRMILSENRDTLFRIMRYLATAARR